MMLTSKVWLTRLVMTSLVVTRSLVTRLVVTRLVVTRLVARLVVITLVVTRLVATLVVTKLVDRIVWRYTTLCQLLSVDQPDQTKPNSEVFTCGLIYSTDHSKK